MTPANQEVGRLTTQLDLDFAGGAIRLDVTRFEAWPFPGLTAVETAQSVLSKSSAFREALVGALRSSGQQVATDKQAFALIPPEWKEALGRWGHGSLTQREAQAYGIDVKYVAHDKGGFHWEYRIRENVNV